jgi:hypothetical protein
MSSLIEFTFDITLPLSFDVLGLKYISSTIEKDCSIIHPRFKFKSDKLFVIESKYLLNSFFLMFFKYYPELKVEYSDLSFSYKDNKEIKDTETCENVFNKVGTMYKNIVVSYL